MSVSPLIIRQNGDDTSITDATLCYLTVAGANTINQTKEFHVATDGSSQFRLRRQWLLVSEGGTGVTITVRTFGAIFKRGITP